MTDEESEMDITHSKTNVLPLQMPQLSSSLKYISKANSLYKSNKWWGSKSSSLQTAVARVDDSEPRQLLYSERSYWISHLAG